MTKPLRIGIAGLGTVGAGTLSIIEAHGKLLAARCGREFHVTAVSARDRTRDRGVDLSAVRWFDNAVELAADSEIDVVLELIGGSDGIAKEVVETALANGKHVVTANKALLAHHGTQLARAAEDARVYLGYEAAVAGGIPVIKSLREGLGGNAIDRVYGILNGTCNYILTAMRESGRDFSEVLEEAQALGYAEADPSFDVDGVDAAHKLAILTALAFGCEVDFDSVSVEGIREISALDIAYAEELGYRIKLLGIAQQSEGAVLQRVHPCMVAKETPIANVEGVFNAVVAEGDFVGRILSEGAGAGAGPTASAVVADMMDIARGSTLPTFAIPAAQLAPSKGTSMAAHVSSHYVRLMVTDRPGVIADVAAALRDEEISMEAMLQRGHAPGEPVPVVITTHATTQQHIASALQRIEAMEAVLEPPRMIRIESL
ncbi:homoserine dehydrogenase [Denitrobaculum tricleocarpae]|uniref:Homoserine dehydrogenase n=1 Tax=Denitrobaculum tricleocarpae TaxID=2591009 RepID=A0A545TT63_9PROT|nr:homoserine dehydrogenase [Denitrobaculum tricleocarpae]TQV80410.1 homoserine dehydrogenase [Denitrobaculum tricleocarpae]